jgi:uncharacterized protein YyaL (SSP411 family)
MASGGDETHPFHFSPRPNRAHEIRWQEWGEEAFARAAREDKPILLGISAVWCHWCHVMDETSYSDDAVISLINEHFVPIRVDNDQRPDVNARYNMGGWPTTAFLTPDGEVLAGLTYVPPEQMRRVLEELSAYYRDHRDQIRARIAEIQESRGRTEATRQQERELTPQIFEHVLAAVGDAYDPVYGGFGAAPKFPHTDAIDLLLLAHLRSKDPDLLHMARKTLEQMAGGGVFDQEWGGFFRYATNRDWSVPHFEKMLEDNANLLSSYLRLYRISGNQEHASTAERIIDYLDRWLSDGASGVFYGSQDADESFYSLTAAEREKAPAPYVDETVYTSWNAMAASAYLEASWTLDRPALGERALKALDFLWTNCRADGQGMHRFYRDGPQVSGLLADQAYMARALLDAYEVSGLSQHLERAEELASLLLDRFADGAGGFFDVWEGHESLGRLSTRHKPLTENAVCAEVFLRLHSLTHRGDYQEVARRTLAAFVGDHEAMGHFAAAYARAVDLFLQPRAEVTVVGDPHGAAAPLHSAALRLALPARTVQALHPERDGARLEALTLPAEPSPAAYVCYGTLCSPPVTSADELAGAVERTREAAEVGTRGLAAGAPVDPETLD